MTLWSGRFSSPMNEALWNLSESFSFDVELYAHDIQASKAHVRGLHHAGLLSDDESQTLVGALDQIAGEFANGTFVASPQDEDVHMAIERRATELVGDLGRRIHTARSRNDQVATALRLYTRDAISEIARDIMALIDALIELADANQPAYLPGYTHLQRAQPVLLTHHLQAHAFGLLRDVERLMQTRQRLNVSPLGAGAIAGTSLPIDPTYVAGLLGFDAPFANSMDATSDRDFVAETLFDCALVAIHCSRMGEELVLWTTSEFGFATLGDDFTTGSSMLPQKKNSDVAELARGKSGRVVGNLVSLLVTLKGLPLAYNRDLQEDKEPLFDSVQTITTVLRALRGAYGSLTFHHLTAAQAADDELLVAIDIAEAMVASGVPFREAHEQVGKLVAQAISTSASLQDVVAQLPDADTFMPLFAPRAALKNRLSPGGSGPVAAGHQRAQLDAERARLAAML
jgi:argininosuccinate lyase